MLVQIQPIDPAPPSEDLDPAIAALLTRVVRRAVARAAENVPGVDGVEFVGAEIPPALAQGGDTRPAATAPSRYQLPSYDDEGRPVELPLVESGSEAEATSTDVGEVEAVFNFEDGLSVAGEPVDEEFRTSGGDLVVRRAFPRMVVLRAIGNNYYYTGRSPYVVAENVARAHAWGRHLFGRSGYAILQGRGPRYRHRFVAAQMAEALSVEDIGGLGEMRHEERAGASVAPGRADTKLHDPRGYTTVAVVTEEGIVLNRPFGGAWDPQRFNRAIRSVAPAERRPETSDVEMVVQTLARDRGPSGGQLMLDLIIGMDRAAFTAMSWEQRAEIVEALIEAWTGEREEATIVEIIKASHSRFEVEVIAAMLRRRGIYEQLFDDIDGQLFGLLRALRAYSPRRSVSSAYLIEVISDQISLGPPGSGADAIDELERAAGGLLDWLGSTWHGIEFLLTSPGKVLEGLGHLAEFLWMVEKAKYGDPEARMMIATMMTEAGVAVGEAIAGLEYAERAGLAAGEAPGIDIGAGVLGRLKVALVIEVLTWFVGIGEVKAAISAVNLTDRAAALARVLRTLGRLGRVGARGAADVSKLERLLAALARAADLAAEVDAAGLVRLLPDNHLTALERMAELLDLPEGATAAALRAATSSDSTLTTVAGELTRALALTERVERRAGGAAAVTARMKDGLHYFMTFGPNDSAAALRVIDAVPTGRMETALHALTFARPEHMARWRVDGLATLMADTRAIATLRDAGSDVVAAMARRVGMDEVGDMARALDLKRGQTADPVELQRFLDRLKRDEDAAFTELADVLHRHRVVRAEAAGRIVAFGLERLRGRGHRELLHYLDMIEDVATRNDEIAAMARLPDKELDGLEHVAGAFRQWQGRTSSDDWVDLALHALDPSARRSLLTIVDDVAPHVDDGLDDVLEAFFQYGTHDLQGRLGELLAVRTIINRYNATAIRLAEMHRLPLASRLLSRDQDILAMIGGRLVHIEVKSYRAARISRWQVIKDLVRHAPDDYRSLMYIYDPGAAGVLPDIARMMRNLFGTDDIAPDATLIRLMDEAGVDIDAARRAFERWLEDGRLTTYDIDPIH